MALLHELKKASITQSETNAVKSEPRYAPGISNSAMGDLWGTSAPAPHTESLSQAMQAKMEQQFGVPFHNVRVHFNSMEPDALGARAFARGNDVHIAPHEESTLEHELTHVAQQAKGLVRATTSIGGVAVNDNASLEHSADLGAMPVGASVGGGAPFGSVAQLCPKKTSTNPTPLSTILDTENRVTTLVTQHNKTQDVAEAIAEAEILQQTQGENQQTYSTPARQRMPPLGRVNAALRKVYGQSPNIVKPHLKRK